MDQATDNQAFGFDDAISKDEGAGSVLLPDGDYRFSVAEFSRERFEGSAKLPPCWKAALRLEVYGGDAGTASVRDNLYLTRNTEWKIGQFFVAIGQKEKGSEGFVPDWKAVPGSSGMVRVGHHSFTGRDGGEVVSNDVKAYLEPGAQGQAAGPRFDASKGF